MSVMLFQIQYEKTRKRSVNENITSDVYDCPAWRTRMGSPRNNHTGVLLCADDTPIHPGCSVTTVEYHVVTLSPLYQLMSTTLKAGAQKKYFDFLK